MLQKPSLKKKRKRFSFKPDFIAESILDIDFAYLKSIGITTCFVDLDGTTVSRGTFKVDHKTSKKLLHSGLDIKIATNRPRSRSLQSLEKSLGASGVIHPAGLFGKPTKRYITLALKEFHLSRKEVVMIGDRYVQDILGANRSGIYSLLVHKLGKHIGVGDLLISRMEYKKTRKLSKKYRTI